MTNNPAAALPRVRWARALIAAILAEAIVIAVTLALGAAMADPTEMVIPTAALILFVPAGYWTARGTSAPVLNGLVTGVWGIALFVLLTLVTAVASGNFDLTGTGRPAYLLAHVLKVVGGVIGGWLVARRAAPPVA